MDIQIYKIKQFASTYKRVIVVDNTPICIVKGEKTASDVIAYIQGFSSDLKDGKIKKIIDKYLANKGDNND